VIGASGLLDRDADRGVQKKCLERNDRTIDAGDRAIGLDFVTRSKQVLSSNYAGGSGWQRLHVHWAS
jgi:hypothetical protein